MTRSHHTPTIARPIADTLQEPISGARVLILAPTGDMLTEIVMQLAADDVEVISAHKAQVATARLHREPPTVVLLYPELELTSGYLALEQLRASGAVSDDCPAIAFSDHAEPLNRLRALQRGCLDFLALPIFYPELVARLQLAIGRGAPRRSIVRIAGGLELNLKAQTVRQNGQEVHLPRYEYELLCELATDPERLFTKRELLRDIWGMEPRSTRTLDAHACRLRQRLRAAGGPYVHNSWGAGYRLLSRSAL